MRKAAEKYMPDPTWSEAVDTLDISSRNAHRLSVHAPGVGGTERREARQQSSTVLELALDARAIAPPQQSSTAWAVKRALDIVLGAALLVLTLPATMLVALLIRCTSRGSVIFRQSRVGHGGREFMMYKFRTMRADAASHEEQLAKLNGDRVFLKIEDDDRVTPVGRFLRKYSLDELPQLINVLRGEMSLVGPRPLLLSDMDRFPRGRWERRFAVPPGMTGLWQVSGRSLCSDEERVRLDLDYVEHWSIGLDLYILLLTPAVVLMAKGAY